MTRHRSLSILIVLGLSVAVGVVVFAAKQRSLHRISSVAATVETEPSTNEDSKGETQVEDHGNTHDFGVVVPGVELRHAFTITNRWEKAFEVKDIQTSCGCTAVKIGKYTLAPGETTRLGLKVLTRESGERLRAQIVVKGIVDGKSVELPFDIKADAPPLARVKDHPQFVDLGERPIGEVFTQEVTIARGPSPISWDEIVAESNDSRMSATLTESSSDRWTASIRWAPENSIGSLDATLNLILMYEGKRVPGMLKRTVIGRVRGPIRAAPESILFGTIRAGETATNDVELLSPEGKTLDMAKLTINTIESASPDRIHVSHASPNSLGMLQVSYTGGESRGTDSGGVVVKLVWEGKPYELRIDYLAYVVP